MVAHAGGSGEREGVINKRIKHVIMLFLVESLSVPVFRTAQPQGCFGVKNK